MGENTIPILYSNDACPFALRARIALLYSGIEVEHREIQFDNKPPSMLAASAKGTVPTMVLGDGTVIDESWDVIRWAVKQNDPDNWCGDNNAALELAAELVEKNDSHFSTFCYYYQYADDCPDRDRIEDRENAAVFARDLEQRLCGRKYFCGSEISIADVAVYPFVKDFSTVEPEWFARTFPELKRWTDDVSGASPINRVESNHEAWVF